MSKEEGMRMTFEDKMKKDLKKDLEIPAIVEQKIQDAYKEIKRGEIKKMKKQEKRSKAWAVAAAAMAVIVSTGTVVYTNPVLVKNIPVIGNVFEKLLANREKDPYAEKDITAYGKIAENAENVENAGTTAENQGVTVTVSDAYCDGYDLYFTMTAATENEQMNRKTYLTMEKDLRVSIDGEETGAELLLEKADNGSYVGLGHISADWMENHEFSSKSTVTIRFDKIYGLDEDESIDTRYVEGTNLISGQWNLKFAVDTDTSQLKTYQVNAEDEGFTVTKVVKAPASTYLYLQVPEKYEDVQMILTDAQGNRLEAFGGTTTDPKDGMYEIKWKFVQTDTNEIHVKVVDMNESHGDDLAVVADIPVVLE